MRQQIDEPDQLRPLNLRILGPAATAGEDEMPGVVRPHWRPTLGGLFGDWYREIDDVTFDALWTDTSDVVGDLVVDEFPLTSEDADRVGRALEVGRAFFGDLVGMRTIHWNEDETRVDTFYADVIEGQLVVGVVPKWLAESGE